MSSRANCKFGDSQSWETAFVECCPLNSIDEQPVLKVLLK